LHDVSCNASNGWLKYIDLVSREALTGQFAGLLKFRVGDYRVLYEIIEEEQVLIVHVVGHRREVYRR